MIVISLVPRFWFGETCHVKTSNYLELENNFEIKDMYHEMFKHYHVNLPKTFIETFTSCGKFFKSLSTVLESSMRNSTRLQEDLEHGKIENFFS